MAVDRPALEHLGKLLHEHFDELVHQPLPPQLHELVERLKTQGEAEKPKKSETSEESPQEFFNGLRSFRTAPA
jgi:hypothetical protein